MSNAAYRYPPLLAAILGIALASCGEPPNGAATTEAPLLAAEALRAPKDEGFHKAWSPITIRFPRDHGSHPKFKTEWWYFTGNVMTRGGRRFGYQFTIFRFALSPEEPDGPSSWATNQAYMAHLAVTDVEADHFYHDERFARGALGLAGVIASPFRAWLEDWSAVSDDATAQPSCNGCMALRLTASNESIGIALSLASEKPAALHGQRGLSRKSDRPGNASYYYSLSRLATHGTIRIGTQTHEASGLSWFDHEWATSYLEQDQAGWDWFSLQLPGPAEIMLFRLRSRFPGGSDFTSGSYVGPDGTVIPLKKSDFSIETLATWKSPHTATVYPGRWRIELPRQKAVLNVTPWIAGQEMNQTFRYWEGAVRVEGQLNKRPVSGHGYVELTGYR